MAYTTAGNAQRDAGEALSLAGGINTILRSGGYHEILRSLGSGYPEWVPNNSEGVWPFTAINTEAIIQCADGAYHVFYISKTEWGGPVAGDNLIYIIYDDNENNNIESIYIGETKVYPDPKPDYFYIEAVEAGYFEFDMEWNSAGYFFDFEYSTGNGRWNRYTFNNNTFKGLQIFLRAGERMYIRGYNPDGFSRRLQFSSNNKVALGGNIMTLIDPTGKRIDVPDMCFVNLFMNSLVTSAPKLPALRVGDSGYSGMFFGCQNLTLPPALPATWLDDFAYANMFMDCVSLASLPYLPATYLPGSCYYDMFLGCTKIKLSTTNTGDYDYLFEIPEGATVVTTWNYGMFANTGGTFKGDPVAGKEYYTTSILVR